jgi:hypothetical protein
MDAAVDRTVSKLSAISPLGVDIAKPTEALPTLRKHPARGYALRTRSAPSLHVRLPASHDPRKPTLVLIEAIFTMISVPWRCES